MFGSVPLRTYLPDGDIDLSIFCSPEAARALHNSWAIRLQAVLEQEQKSPTALHRVGDVTVINAEASSRQGQGLQLTAGPFPGSVLAGCGRTSCHALI